MNSEDDEFNRIEREASLRMEAVIGAVHKERQEYERGFIDGMQEQMKRSVDKAVNAMAQRPWVGLTDAELAEFSSAELGPYDLCLEVEAKLREKNESA
jgi:hypothetical protein